MSALYLFFLSFWIYNAACTQARLDVAVSKGYITAAEEQTILATPRQIAQ